MNHISVHARTLSDVKSNAIGDNALYKLRLNVLFNKSYIIDFFDRLMIMPIVFIGFALVVIVHDQFSFNLYATDMYHSSFSPLKL